MLVKNIQFAVGKERIEMSIEEASRVHSSLVRLFDREVAPPHDFPIERGIHVDEEFLPRGWKKVNENTVRVVK
jgi:hypothetical protein